MAHWMLPEDVIELLPEDAAKTEKLRRQLLDAMAKWGYRLVTPPLVEFLDSLLAGSGDDLDVQTFKLTDQYSGKLMGVRADITPQIARIDAHRLPSDEVSRFSYCGEVLRTQSESTEPRRNPIIIGAELYGVASPSGDVEIMSLLLSLLEEAGIGDTLLDVGHSGIYAGLVRLHRLDGAQQRELYDLLIGIRRPDLQHWKERRLFPDTCIEDIAFLVDAPLRSDGLKGLDAQFSGRHPLLDEAISDLRAAREQLVTYLPGQKISLDPTAVGSYGYHSGLLFAIYTPGHYDAIARGGRYDGVGKVYGRSRPATGFSADLLTLVQLFSCEDAGKEDHAMAMPRDGRVFSQAAARRHAGETVRFEHRQRKER